MEKVEEHEAYKNKVALAAANRPVRGKAREKPTQEQGKVNMLIKFDQILVYSLPFIISISSRVAY